MRGVELLQPMAKDFFFERLIILEHGRRTSMR